MRALENTAPQGSEEWLKAKIGYVTASHVADVMAKGQGKMRESLMVRMICEILTGKPVKGFKSDYMQNGNDREKDSARLYSLITGQELVERGFCYLEDEKLGASIDREVAGTDGIVEIKNVIASEQIRLLTLGTVPGKYMKQMQTQLYITEKIWCDYVSTSFGDEVNGTLPNKYKVKIIRVNRDEKMIAEIRTAVAEFHRDLIIKLNKLKELK